MEISSVNSSSHQLAMVSSPPSSPLSVLSQSPAPPSPIPLTFSSSSRYPSPTASSMASSTSSGHASPRKRADMADSTEEIRVRTDGPPPTKRRRVAEPKPRTTTYIDLENLGNEPNEGLNRLLTALRKKKKIVVFAGAGISVSAGIPDFRSSTGLFASNGKHLFDASVYKHPHLIADFHSMVRKLAELTSKAEPTPFHHMLASLAAEGRLMRMYSQNIDTLDTKMPPLSTNIPLNTKGPWPTTIQLHGGLEKMVCILCGNIEPLRPELFDGPELPLCEKCEEADQVRTTFAGKRSHGIGKLRPRIVLYNEPNPDEEAIGNVSKADLRRVPDAVIVVGTTLKVPGARRLVKEMCKIVRSRRDGLTVWINIDPEPQGADFKDCWDLVVRGRADDVAQLVNLPRWDQQDNLGDRADYMVSGDEEKERKVEEAVRRSSVEVVIEGRVVQKEKEAAKTPANRKSKHAEQNGPMPTPSASPRVRSPMLTGKTQPAKKQSTLSFGSVAPKGMTTTAAKTTSTKVTTTTKRKPRQTKKSVTQSVKPLNRLDKTFKTTKSATVSLTKDLKDMENIKLASRSGSSSPRKCSAPLEDADDSGSDLSEPLDLPSPAGLDASMAFSFDSRDNTLPSLRPVVGVGGKS